MTASDLILRKALVGSKIDSSEWSKIQAGLRDRAFFSSQVESQKILYQTRSMVSEITKHAKSPSEFRRDMRAYLDSIGYDPDENLKDGEKSRVGTIKDLRVKSRLDVIWRTQRDQARGFIQWKQFTSKAALEEFPAYRLIRVKQRKQQRNWDARWEEAKKRVNGEGVFKGGDKVALKSSPIWTAISRFGHPFPPFDFGSGMGIENVSIDECIKMGFVKKDDPPQKVPDAGFNDSLRQEVPFDNTSPEYSKLREKFGDQIQYNKEKHEVQWRSELFADMFDPGKKFTLKLGQSTQTLLNMLPSSIPATSIQGKQLIITQDWLNKKRQDGVTDHRVHFGPMADQPNDIPLKKGDVDMLPSLWREPDRVFESHGRIVLEVDAIDGGMFRAVVDVKKNPILKTFYRTLEQWKP